MIEITLGLVYASEEMIVSSGRLPYFLSGAITAIILDLAACVLNFVNKAGAMSIGTNVVDICIAAYLIKLIKEINS